MRQRNDCGCGGKGPSLERLIALAREQNLPTLHPDPARVAATLRGRVEWALINRDGITERHGRGPNLILDQGLDQIATQEIKVQQPGTALPPTFFPIIRYAAVGTDNTTPAVGQTGLGAEVGRTDATYQTETLTRPSNGVYELTRFIEFDYEVGNGNLTEWGFSYASTAGGNLFNRALFLDGGGSPEVVTNTTEYKLRLIYTLEVALSPTTVTAASFEVAGVGTVGGAYTLLGSAAPPSAATRCTAPDLVMFSTLARGPVRVASLATLQGPASGSLRVSIVDVSSDTYTSTISFTNDLTELLVNRHVGEERDAYVPGSFERTGGLWKFETQHGNAETVFGFLIGGTLDYFGTGCQRMGYAFAIDAGDRFTKDDEHTLTIGVPTVSWGRA